MICDGEGCLNKATIWFYLASQDEPAKMATLYDMCPKCAATALFKAQAELRKQLSQKWEPAIRENPNGSAFCKGKNKDLPSVTSRGSSSVSGVKKKTRDAKGRFEKSDGKKFLGVVQGNGLRSPGQKN